MRLTTAINNRLFHSVLVAALLALCTTGTALASTEIKSEEIAQKTILITGASSGLGRMLELNENQTFTYDRQGLIKLLDEELANMKQ